MGRVRLYGVVDDLYQPDAVFYYKVFSYSAQTAKVFVVIRGSAKENTNLLGVDVFLARGEPGWQKAGEKLGWATHGSADGWTWPPYGSDPTGVWRLLR